MGNTTEAFAAKLGIAPQSLRARLCKTGTYYGIKPTKLPNGRLWWPDDSFERVKQSPRGDESRA